MTALDQPVLLFFDTFSHDSTEELNLDLVQFPKSVYLREIRIIPLGARVEGDFPGGVRLGATNPTTFHIDFFVNNLSKPGACTFESLGSIDFNHNGQIHMECGNDPDEPRIPTDGLVLKGCYTTLTLAVYGNFTQISTEVKVGTNAPTSVPRSAISSDAALPLAKIEQPKNWNPENPIPTYTGNVAVSNADAYSANDYPQENYDAQVYRSDYYSDGQLKEQRSFENDEWDAERKDISDRDRDRLRQSPRSLEGDRRRRSADKGRSRESSRHRERSRDRIESSHLRSRDDDYLSKGEYRASRSRSRSRDRLRASSTDRDWDRVPYRDDSYDRSQGGNYGERSPSYERRSFYDKRAPSYERKLQFDRENSYERRAPSYERQAPYEKKRQSPFSHHRSGYGSRSPSRDDVRKRTIGEASRRQLSPRSRSPSSYIISSGDDFDKSNKIPRVEFYHENYRHQASIRSPSVETEQAPFEQKHSSLVTVPLVDITPTAESIQSPANDQDAKKCLDPEPFEPILSDEDICDDDEPPFIDYMDANDSSVEDIKYYNPFKEEWKQYVYVNKIQMAAPVAGENVKDVLNASFDELCDASPDLFKISEMANTAKKEQFFKAPFSEIDNTLREEWVHQCEQVIVSLQNICKYTDIPLRIFKKYNNDEEYFTDLLQFIVKFCSIGLNFEDALTQQQPTYKIRHIKCGIRLAEVLFDHKHSGKVMESLLEAGIDVLHLLMELYSKEYMALSIRLMIMKSLNSCLSSRVAITHFLNSNKFPIINSDKECENVDAVNGYQHLIRIMQSNPLSRLKFSISSLIKKINIYELLENLHRIVTDLNSKSKDNPNVKLSDDDVDFIISSLEELLYMYRAQCFHISQPKRFLPVSAQYEINKDCSNQVLLEFFKIHHTLEAFIFLLTCPSTCNNITLISPLYDLIHEIVYSQNGIYFMYDNINASQLLFKILLHPYSQQNCEEYVYPYDLGSYADLQILGLEIAFRLRAIYHLQSIDDVLQSNRIDENELIDRLQALYCLSIGGIGKTAVSDIIVMSDNADCLMEVFEKDLKNRIKNDALSKQKSPAKGYAIELIVSAVRFSSNVPFFKKYGQRLVNVSKEHDRFEPGVSSILQEVIPYLQPIEKPNVLSGEDMAECIEIIKGCSEHSADFPGELSTCLRILRHYCISDYDSVTPVKSESAIDEYVELKYKHNVLQLFSMDGVSVLVGILDKLATHFDQPNMHTSFFASTKGLQLAQTMLPCLKLLDEMLARVVQCRGSKFRDLTAAPILLKSYGIAKAFPISSIGFRTASKACEASINALLAYAQPIAEVGLDGDSIRQGPWTSLCSEVLSYIMTAPYTFVSGLLIFSELLPLPLPIQTKLTPTERELEDASNERRLWSAHLHPLANELIDMIQTICMSTYRPVVHMLRRVCVQIADLAPNTAMIVAKAAVGAVMKEFKPEEPASSSGARIFGFLACLVSHAPIKCAVLNMMSGANPKPDLLSALSGVLSLSNANQEHVMAQEFIAHALAAFCDVEVSLTPTTANPEILLSNSLPNKETLMIILEASADCLESSRSSSVAASILRAYFVLTEHEYGFQLFKKFVSKKKESFAKFFEWVLAGPADDKVECFSLYLDLIKILRVEEGEGPMGRKSVLTVCDIANMVGYAASDSEHPVLSLEKTLRERNFEEEAISNANIISSLLQNIKSYEESDSPMKDISEIILPATESLVIQFSSRVLCGAGEANDERLTCNYWLNIPSVNGDEEVNDSDLVWCDVAGVADSLVSGGAEAAAAAVRRLAGCGASTHAPPADDKRLAVSLSRARGGESGDAFRSRPPNTSRPPSLHVDDFTALHHAYPKPPNARAGGRRGAERGRFAAPTSHVAHPYTTTRGRSAWESAAGTNGPPLDHFSASPYLSSGAGWGQRPQRHRANLR